MNIEELYNYNFPKEVIDIWKEFGYTELLPIQQEAIAKNIFEDNSLLIIAPTSSGKTFVGEMAALHNAFKSMKTLYLVPFKAIAEEKYLDFISKYEDLGLSIYISDQDHREYDTFISTGNYDVAILTYEKLSSLLISSGGIIESTNCIIIDEIQMLMDSERGGTLELLLTKILSKRDSYQLLALSAVLDNLNGFDEWLKTDVINSKKRPIELRMGIYTDDGSFNYTEWNSQNDGSEKLGDGSLNNLIKNLLDQEEQIVIVAHSINKVHELAFQLSSDFSTLKASSKTIKELKEGLDTETREKLLETLRCSIAFHHADCELFERRVIETGFREGEIRILVATTTISMGVNLPCKTVILANNKKWTVVRETPQLVNWKVGEVRNILGRAGRFGIQNDFGRGILVAENKLAITQLKNAYILAPLEKLKSAFANKDISLRVLDIVSSNYGGTDYEIELFMFKTFAAKDWDTPVAKQQIQEYIQAGIKQCLENELFHKSDSNKITSTSLGLICAAKGCSIESFIKLKSFIEKVSNINYLDIAYLCATLKEVSKPYYRVFWNNYNRIAKIRNRLTELSSEEHLMGFVLSNFNKNSYWNEDEKICYTIATLCHDIFLTKTSYKDLRDGYHITTSSIRKICSNLSWMLDILYEISKAMNFIHHHELKVFSECIRTISPRDCRFLTNLNANLHRDDKIKLCNNQFISEEDFIDAVAEDFKNIINPAKIDRILKNLNNKREKNIKYWEKEHIRRLSKIGYNTSNIKELYTQKGINLERAIENLFKMHLSECTIERITNQQKREPDLFLYFSDGKKFTIQVTAKESATKYIDSKKSDDIIAQSSRFQPDGYICIGRPDFQDFAKEQAFYHSKRLNFKLLPIYIIAELFVQFIEKRIDERTVSSFLYEKKGYLEPKDIYEFTRDST